MYYYEERCLGARSERLFLNEKERKDSRFSPFSFVFFFDETVKFFHQPWKREKRKKKSDVSPFDFSLVDRFDTNNNFNNNNNKKKKKKKTKEIDNKYTEYS